MKLQTDDYSCGPISLINAFIYSEEKYPPISTCKLKHECSTSEYGTERWNMMKNTLIKLDKKPVYNKKKIQKMKAFILLYSFSDLNAHYVFVIKKNEECYKIFNYYNVKDNSYMHIKMNPKEFLDSLLKNNRINDLDYPLAWEIMKK